MEFSVFKDYVICKAFDVISGDGSYRRYLYQCVDAQDEWAVRMHANVAKVTQQVRETQALCERVKALETPVSRVCAEVVTAMHAPARVVKKLSVCYITGAHVENCVDVSRATKSETPVLIHPKFHYFFMMLYFVHRLEHVVRSYTKCWLDSQDQNASMKELSDSFENQTETLRQLHQRYVEGHQHVIASIQHYLCHAS